MKDLVLRFLIGGSIVSVFAMLGDLFEPKSFAGIFGAAPSVALATLALTIGEQGKVYAATELRSAIIGAIAFLVYAIVLTRALVRCTLPSNLAAPALTAVWAVVAMGLWAIVLR